MLLSGASYALYPRGLPGGNGSSGIEGPSWLTFNLPQMTESYLIYAAVSARDDGTSNRYEAQLQYHTGTGTLELVLMESSISGSQPLAGPAMVANPIAPAATYRVHLHVVDGTPPSVDANAWMATDPEPPAWLLSEPVAALSSGSYAGARAGSPDDVKDIIYAQYDSLSIRVR